MAERFRTITAEQFRDGTDTPPHDGWDEAYVVIDGIRSEIWDVAIKPDQFGNIILYLPAGDYGVKPSHPVEVR